MRPLEPEPTAPDLGAQLAAEVSARLMEWAETGSRTRVTRWLATLNTLHRADPAAMWLYIAWQTGNTATIAASFEERGKGQALPRQAVQQATAKAFAAMRSVCPELADAMREVFEIHAPEAEKTSPRLQ